MPRLDYAVCIVEIQTALQVEKNIAGLPVTASFLSYGVGQLICGFLGDRYEPRKMIFAGLTGAVSSSAIVSSDIGLENDILFGSGNWNHGSFCVASKDRQYVRG